MGSALAAELRAVAQPVNDSEVTALVDELCKRLSACVRDKRRTFHCEVVHGDSPNAVALPGGFVFLSHSLVDLCERRPDELAFVIGHEMAHVIRRHAWDRMVNQAMLRVASVVTARAGVLGGWLRKGGLELLQNAHARNSELEADEFGLRLAIAARFAPAGAISLLRRIERLGNDPSVLGQYFASHPPAAERIARLEPKTHPPAANPEGKSA